MALNKSKGQFNSNWHPEMGDTGDRYKITAGLTSRKVGCPPNCTNSQSVDELTPQHQALLLFPSSCLWGHICKSYLIQSAGKSLLPRHYVSWLALCPVSPTLLFIQIQTRCEKMKYLLEQNVTVLPLSPTALWQPTEKMISRGTEDRTLVLNEAYPCLVPNIPYDTLSLTRYKP